jgi:putative endonuclease
MRVGVTNTRRGRAAERFAAIFLELRGLQILDRNRRGGGGEVDLVARDGQTLVFVEVRLRGEGRWVGAAASISRQKQARLLACARQLATEPTFDWPQRRLRFDVVLLELRDAQLSMWHHRNVRFAGQLPRRGSCP